MIYWNKNEKAIIDNFLMKAYYNRKKRMVLLWNDGSMAVAKFDWFSEDENDYDPDEPEYEEFWSIDFIAEWIVRDPPVEITKDLYFIVNYHNFPEVIYMEMDLAKDVKTAVGNLAGSLRKIRDVELVFLWNDGSIVIARYESHDFGGSPSVAAKNKDGISIRFNAVRVIGTPPVDIDDNQSFTVNSRNFPDTIFEEIDRQTHIDENMDDAQ